MNEPQPQNGLRVASSPRVEVLMRAYAQAKARYASELGARRLVIPDSQDFPDRFTEDEASTQRLLARMQAHAGMSDIPISLRISERNATQESSSCSSGACAPMSAPSPADFARVTDDGDQWVFTIPTAELRHPVLLTSGLARSLALVFFVETEEPGDGAASPFRIELIAILLGFGGILLQGAHVYQKSCAGPRIDQFTALDVSETAFLCALMALDVGAGLGRLPKLVEATQRAALSESLQIIGQYPDFLRLLAQDPHKAIDAPLQASAPTGFLQKLLGRFRTAEQLPGDDLQAWQRALEAAPRPQLSSGKRPRLEKPSQELIDLVKSEL